MKKSLASLCLLSALFSFTATAGTLIEPYLGYVWGNTSTNNVSNSDKGTGFGLRLGLDELGLMGGLEYSTGTLTDNATPSNNIAPTDIGVFVGFNFPILLRVYGTYLFSSKAAYSVNGFSDTYSGNGLKIGIGYTGLPIPLIPISINFEYMTHTYTSDSSNLLNGQNPKNTGYAITLSLPFNL